VSETLSKDAIQEIVKLARSGATVQTARDGSVPFAVVPADCQVESLADLIFNEHNARPERIKQAVKVSDAASFVEYYTLFHDENSRLFAWEPSLSVTAVIDYHAAGSEQAPRWGSHSITLTLQQSDECKIWNASNGKQFGQMEFAEFLEQNSMDIMSPDPAHVVEVARDLAATTEVEFGSGSRTQDGQVRFKYQETVKASVQGGALAVPDRFTIGIPVFIGGDVSEIGVLLRFRVRDGHLVLWYTLVRPDKAKRNAFIAERERIASALSATIINGML
jgi:uncharacterized protein YfdQ (DUF2303 family)